MAKRLDVLEAELEQIQKIKMSGVLSARIQGREIVYRSYAELREAEAEKQREIDMLKGLLLPIRRRSTRMYPRLGF